MSRGAKGSPWLKERIIKREREKKRRKMSGV